MACLGETVAVFAFSRTALPDEGTDRRSGGVAEDKFIDFIPYFWRKIEQPNVRLTWPVHDSD